MRIETLIHLAASASVLVPDIRLYVFGSASAPCTYPDLPDSTDSYANTLDADFIFEPWSPEIEVARALGYTKTGVEETWRQA